ncbi:hypothetical protein [Nonomuraea sp. NPDC003754]
MRDLRPRVALAFLTQHPAYSAGSRPPTGSRFHPRERLVTQLTAPGPLTALEIAKQFPTLGISLGDQRPQDPRVPTSLPAPTHVPKAWTEAITDAASGRIERIPYELCVLIALREALRRREVYVEGAGRWRNLDEDLPGGHPRRALRRAGQKENWNGANDKIFYGKERRAHRPRPRARRGLHAGAVLPGLRQHPAAAGVLADPAWAERLTAEDRRGLSPLFWSHINS